MAKNQVRLAGMAAVVLLVLVLSKVRGGSAGSAGLQSLSQITGASCDFDNVEKAMKCSSEKVAKIFDRIKRAAARQAKWIEKSCPRPSPDPNLPESEAFGLDSFVNIVESFTRPLTQVLQELADAATRRIRTY